MVNRPKIAIEGKAIKKIDSSARAVPDRIMSKNEKSTKRFFEGERKTIIEAKRNEIPKSLWK